MLQTCYASVFPLGKQRTERRSKNYLLRISHLLVRMTTTTSASRSIGRSVGREAKIHAIRIEKLFEKGNEAFVRYECELKDGARFRNTEYLRIEGNKIREVEVYFGSSVKAAASSASSTVIAPTRKSSRG
jgi:hypothetical protein